MDDLRLTDDLGQYFEENQCSVKTGNVRGPGGCFDYFLEVLWKRAQGMCSQLVFTSIYKLRASFSLAQYQTMLQNMYSFTRFPHHGNASEKVTKMANDLLKDYSIQSTWLTRKLKASVKLNLRLFKMLIVDPHFRALKAIYTKSNLSLRL